MAYLLRKYIPEDILHWHIIPFTYLPQSAPLQKDLKTYVFTYNKILAFYSEQGPLPPINFMMFDLMEYYGQYVLKAPGFVLLENTQNTDAASVELAAGRVRLTATDAASVAAAVLFRKLLAGEPLHAIRILWGRMTPVDRLKFMVKKIGRSVN